MSVDVVLLSPWTEPVRVSPSYQLVRNEITRAAGELARRKLADFFVRHRGRAAIYGDVVRYQEQLPYCPGLLSIAAVLEQAGHSVRCVSLDLERERDGGDGWLERAIERTCSDVGTAVGITAVTPEIERALRALELVRVHAPHARTMLGGTHPTYDDLTLSLHPAVDVVVRGEGEATALDLVELWTRGEPVMEVAGTTVSIDGAPYRNRDRALVDASTLPMPAYRSFGGAERDRIIFTPTYSRGCPHACNYCVESVFWQRRVRYKQPRAFAEELALLVTELDQHFIHIADSTFGIDREATAALCDELDALGLDAVFSCNIRPDASKYIGADLLARLVRSGFVEFYVGYESADTGLLAGLERRQTDSALMETLVLLRELGVPFVKLYLILGLPGETHSGLQSTLNRIRELQEAGLVYYATGKFFVPTPGTAQYTSSDQNGYRFATRDWEAFERYNFPPVVRHDRLSWFELEPYMCLLQAMQLAHFRKLVGEDPRERDRVLAWTESHYVKKVYL